MFNLTGLTDSTPHSAESVSIKSLRDASALEDRELELERYPIKITLSKASNFKFAPIPPVFPSYIAPFSSIK